MAHINDPVSEWRISVVELVVPDHPHEGLVVFHTHHFTTVKELGEYLRMPRSYPIARYLGYTIPTPPDPGKYNTRLKGRIVFRYKDRMISRELEFETVANFIRFLEDHPPLAKVVGYVKKSV